MHDDTFYDDSSANLGLTHSATEAVEKLRCEECDATMLAEDAPGHKCSPRFNVKENPLLGDERWNERENRRLDAQAKYQGETMPTAVDRKDRRRLLVNDGAYSKIDERIEELVAEGHTRLEATTIAKGESGSVDQQSEPKKKHGDDCRTDCPSCNAVDDRTLQPEGASDVKGGNRAGKFKRQRKRGTIPEPYILASYSGDGKLRNESDRARAQLEQNQRRMEKRGAGRPPRGSETMMRAEGRIEPSKAQTIHALTKKTTVQFAAEMVPVLERIHNGNEAEAIAAIRELLEAAKDVETESDVAIEEAS